MAYDLTKMVRDPTITRHFVTTQDAHWITKKNCHIVFPESWVGRHLAWIDDDIRILTKFMLVVEDRYTVCNECAIMPVNPDSILMTTINGVSHYDFLFYAGSEICDNLNLLVEDTLLYYIFDEFITKSRIPPYFTYEDAGKLYLNSKYHAGNQLAGNNTILEMIIASIARNADNAMQQWRYMGSSMAEGIKRRPEYISLKNPAYMATNTLTKISGAYFDSGLTSALITENETTDDLEMIVRA